jgi:hypothetical protein
VVMNNGKLALNTPSSEHANSLKPLTADLLTYRAG